MAMVIFKLDKASYGVYVSVSYEKERPGSGNEHGGRAGPWIFSRVLQTDGVPEAVEGRSFGCAGIRVRLDDLAKTVHSRLILHFPFVDVLVGRLGNRSCAVGLIAGSSFRGRRRHLVGARPIQTRHRYVEQSVVHRQLRAMMNQVIEHHAAKASDARHGEDFFAAGQ